MSSELRGIFRYVAFSEKRCAIKQLGSFVESAQLGIVTARLLRLLQAGIKFEQRPRRLSRIQSSTHSHWQTVQLQIGYRHF